MLTGLVSIYVCFATAHALAKSYSLDALAAGLVAVAAFLTALRPSPLQVAPDAMASWGVSSEWLGPGGLFGALAIAIGSVELTRLFVIRNWTIRLPKAVPDAVFRSFASLVPAFACVAIAWIAVHALHFDVVGLAGALVRPLVRAGNTLPLVIGVVLIDSGFWALGVHPMSALAVLKPVWEKMIDENMLAATAGQALPNIAPRELFLWFVWQGGSGGTLSLALLMLAIAKSAQLKSVAKLAIVPSMFNINEPILFGAPVVLNPRLIVPFLVSPLVTATLAFMAISMDLVSRPRAVALWTLPAPLGAFWSSGGDWRAVALQMFNLLVAAAIYFPFLRRYDATLVASESAAGRRT
jgi:PTS system cellobiose-specific IIC component